MKLIINNERFVPSDYTKGITHTVKHASCKYCIHSECWWRKENHSIPICTYKFKSFNIYICIIFKESFNLVI